MPEFQPQHQNQLAALDVFTCGYLTAAEFTMDEKIGDHRGWTKDAISTAVRVCAEFRASVAPSDHVWQSALMTATHTCAKCGILPLDQDDIDSPCIDPLADYPAFQAGADLWYTRNGHGCGYWENDHGTPEGCAVLTAAAKALSENDVYKTHNGYLAFEYNK